MHDELKERVEAIENEHFEQKSKDLAARGDQDLRDRAMQMLGAARYAEQLIKRTGSDLMVFLALVEEEKLYLEYGFPNFATFLTKSPMVPFAKSQYYNHKQLLSAEGTEKYDFYEEWEVPPALRKKVLEAGISDSVQVDGDEIIIEGTERIKVSEPSIVKTILESQIAAKQKLSEKVEKQKEQIKRGQEEFDDVRRRLDNLTNESPFALALMKAVSSLSDLSREVHELSEAERQGRGTDDLKTIASLFHRLQDAYGVNVSLTAPIVIMEESSLEDRAIAEIFSDDDFGDETEVAE